jgi:hypothetical protein
MPAFRIMYLRPEASKPESITAGFASLEQALDVFAARGLRILYIAEQRADSRRPAAPLGETLRKAESKSSLHSSFPLRRFSARAMA